MTRRSERIANLIGAWMMVACSAVCFLMFMGNLAERDFVRVVGCMLFVQVFGFKASIMFHDAESLKRR